MAQASLCFSEAMTKGRGTSIADIPERYHAQIRAQLGPRSTTPDAKPNKYHNKRTAYKSSQGFERVYDSAKEASFAANLDRYIAAREIRIWLPQVAFPLPGGVTYRCDFMTIDRESRVCFYDVKGRDTQTSINKRKQVLAIFGVHVEIV